MRRLLCRGGSACGLIPDPLSAGVDIVSNPHLDKANGGEQLGAMPFLLAGEEAADLAEGEGGPGDGPLGIAAGGGGEADEIAPAGSPWPLGPAVHGEVAGEDLVEAKGSGAGASREGGEGLTESCVRLKGERVDEDVRTGNGR
jgi:hypothetical protein